MKGIKIYLDDHFETELTFDKVVGYYFSNGFLCMTLNNGKAICYNLHKIKRFDVEVSDDSRTNEVFSD